MAGNSGPFLPLSTSFCVTSTLARPTDHYSSQLTVTCLSVLRTFTFRLSLFSLTPIGCITPLANLSSTHVLTFETMASVLFPLFLPLPNSCAESPSASPHHCKVFPPDLNLLPLIHSCSSHGTCPSSGPSPTHPLYLPLVHLCSHSITSGKDNFVSNHVALCKSPSATNTHMMMLSGLRGTLVG